MGHLCELLSSPWTHHRLTASYLVPQQAENWVKGEWCHWLPALTQSKESLLSIWRWQECCGYNDNIKPMHYTALNINSILDMNDITLIWSWVEFSEVWYFSIKNKVLFVFRDLIPQCYPCKIMKVVKEPLLLWSFGHPRRIINYGINYGICCQSALCRPHCLSDHSD